MAKMKVWTKGKALWSRTIGSTVVGQGVDSLIFYPIAFLGIWSTEAVVTVMITNWLLKVVWEAVLTPVTYLVVGKLKKAEGLLELQKKVAEIYQNEIVDHGENEA